jgi:ubiquinone biosynthesis protein UbiJ
MEKKNALTFLLGAIIGGTAAYYAYKHQDELLSGLHDLEESLSLDNNELIEKTKAQFSQLSQNVQEAIGNYTQNSDDESISKEKELTSLMEELARLRAKVEALKS